MAQNGAAWANCQQLLAGNSLERRECGPNRGEFRPQNAYFPAQERPPRRNGGYPAKLLIWVDLSRIRFQYRREAGLVGRINFQKMTVPWPGCFDDESV